MKNRDKILFAVPLLAAFGVAALACALFWHTSEFEQAYLREAQSELLDGESRLAEAAVRPALERGDVRAAVEFCDGFRDAKTRLTLVNASGDVLADSSVEGEASMDNHRSRPEIDAALAGTPNSTQRYSATLDAWMIYAAIPVRTSAGDLYALRVAKSSRDVSRVLSLGKANTALALVLGGAIVLLLTSYILLKVRRPLETLQREASAIAAGELKRKIVVPESGIARELAQTISRMAEQLKTQIREITAERNEREFIFNSLTEGALQIERDGNVVLCNEEARKLFAPYPNARQINIFRCGSPDLIRLVHKAFLTGASIEREIETETNGLRRTLLAQGGIIERGGERFLLLTVTDLTNLRRLESFRSDFIANVSHEIKTPLTSILSAVESLQDGALRSPDNAAKFLKILHAQSKRLNALVRDILSLAALERREVAGEKEFAPVQLDATLENAVNACRDLADAAGFRLEITRNDPIELEGDAQLIEQAIVNLVGNAVKYSGGDRAEISLERRGNVAVVSVRDFGVGIAAEHLPRLFERFYRVHKERSQKLGGTGLGLAIVKHVAQLHGGNAAVESAPGAGTCFRIELPL